jgi:hypothetical protein
MRRLTLFASVLAVALIAAMTSAPARAYPYDKLTYLTFNGPVQIPGVTLDAGTYRFRLANPSTSRNVLQVLSHDGSIVFSMFHTIPDSRMNVTEESIVTFRETPAGVPPAVLSLFYGGEHRGYEFVYPKGGPIMIAKVAPQPAITYAPIAAAAVPEAAAEAEPTPVEVEAVAEPSPEPVVEPVAELPKTASPLPLMAFGGLMSFVLALGARVARGRVR